MAIPTGIQRSGFFARKPLLVFRTNSGSAPRGSWQGVWRPASCFDRPAAAGSLDETSTSGKLQRVVKTKKTELLFMALFLQLLNPGGRAAVIAPDGVLFGSSKAHNDLRRSLGEDHFLEGVASLLGFTT